ncbi:maestro heat-like repeat-containing protein family member 1 isoform X2 [Elephas maximus indicus]|uniref:maestro heat-like repeat-containing protein family member 1 isoform X2 n=1 Tax=Elephas maximus indicus TaxID=99487 RepID=UPI002116B525|nr:maestro heat-like repeat-containing protein family member 1 isoform X2 [Elephas maximus indicus]
MGQNPEELESRGHNEKNLNQKEWEASLLRFLSQSLMAINDDNWLEQLIKDILDKINYMSNDDEVKAFLYKFFGFTLRTSRSPKLVKTMLSSILKTAHEELLDREGIAVALSIVSLRHLTITLDELQEYGTILTNKHTSSILKLMKVMAFLRAVSVSHTKPSKASPSLQPPHFSEAL